MYEWLHEEISRIKTPKFHLVDGPASAKLRQAVMSCDLPLPWSYREFVLQFGNAKLYRRGSNWIVYIYAGPRETVNDHSESLIHFGRSETSFAYFKVSLLVANNETPVFEWRHGQGIRQTNDSFEDWLKTKCDSARKRFKKKEWKTIEEGPPPFNEHEHTIVEARKLIQWRVIGIAPNEDLRFEIYNGSTITLPYLSVGVRGRLRPPKIGPLNGGLFLPVGKIRSGETGVVEKGCYKELMSPEEVEVFQLPDPGPEDREQYWEFRYEHSD